MKTLGKLSAYFISELYNQNKIIFTISDAQKILKKSYNETTDFLSKLVTRKIISRLKAGKFLIIPQEMGNINNYTGNLYVAGREIVNSKQYYIAYYSAMSFRGMLTQPLNTLYIATAKRQIIPKQMNGKVTFVFINKNFMWGIKEEWVTRSEKVKVSDLEKTILDSLYHPEYSGGITEIAKGIWIVKDKIDFNKLHDYVHLYNKNIIAKRLGYILEILNINKEDILKFLKEYVKDRYDLFDSTLDKKKLNENKWRLIDNVGQKQILNIIKY